MADDLGTTPGAGAVLRAKDLGSAKLAQAVAALTMPYSVTGYDADDVTTSASDPHTTIPAGTTHALYTISGGAIRFRQDGQNPSSTSGLYIGDGGAFEIAGATNIDNLRVVAMTTTVRLTCEFRRYDQ